MTQCIAMANQKGGCSKTTLTFNLACALSAQGKKVLCIDMDQQANLSTCFCFNPKVTKLQLADWLQDECTFEELVQHRNGIDFIPTGYKQADYQPFLQAKVNREMQLAKRMAKVSTISDYDYILIDTAPANDVYLANALCAADQVLIPCNPDTFNFVAMQRLRNYVVDIVESGLNEELKINGVLFSRVNKKASEEKNETLTLKALAKNYGWPVYKERMFNYNDYSTSIKSNKSVIQLEKANLARKNMEDIIKEFLVKSAE